MKFVSTLPAIVFTAVVVAAAEPKAVEPKPAEPKAGVIKVEVTGTLTGVTLIMKKTDDTWRLNTAAVRAAGGEMSLDCAECVAARRDLIRLYVKRGEGSTGYADPEVIIKGRLEFRLNTGKGEGKEVITPVLVVESLSFVNKLLLIP